VVADIFAREIFVYGSVEGNLRAGDRIEIKKMAVAMGGLTAPVLVIEDGAYFKGSVEMEYSWDTADESKKRGAARTPAATARFLRESS
jgi:cytoskeletal protein CcmA (bactofilin family)